MKYKEMLKKKGGKDFDGVSTNENSEQAGIVEEVDENPCGVLAAQLGRESTQMLGHLTQGAYTTYAQKESGSVHISLSIEVLS